MLESKRNFIDYLQDKKEYYEAQIELCKNYISYLDHNSIDYKSYKWQICDYESRLDAINDLLGSVKPKD